MDTDVYGKDVEVRRQTFFNLVFGNTSGIMCLAFLTKERKFSEQFYKYPDELPQVHQAIADHLVGSNIYFCAQLFNQNKRKKEFVEAAPTAWADLDFCPPEAMLVDPTVIIETSSNRFQALWKMDKEYDADDVEDLSRRIAYRHAEEGADRSGWDLTQLLRVPFTYNYKYSDGMTVPVTTVIKAGRERYRLEDFSEYPESPGYKLVDEEMPEIDTSWERAEAILQERRAKLNPIIFDLYATEPEGTWSEVLWRLLMMLFEAELNKSEVFTVVTNAACNKYARDKKPARLLWKEVCRAESTAELHHKLLVPKPEDFTQLITDQELERVDADGNTFIERYITWASQLGDAAPQYHQAGAFVVLSSLLSGNVQLPTSFGTIIPNLWFMILADTTLTRKTTSMDIAMDLVMEIDDELIMATDGSLEGLLTALSTRPGRPSIFLRDEFSGLLDAMQKKDYMAGMPEQLTKLYDGKLQRRILRKEVIEVRDPRLVIFAGGIKDRITGILNFEMVSSGFMPRFVFITAESDITKLRPIGPPTERTTGDRDSILAEAMDISASYKKTPTLEVKGKAAITLPPIVDAELTQAAWIRYNQLETHMLQIGLKDQRPDVMTPVGDRLAKSILKASVLVAAARQKGAEGVLVDEIDILRAIKYGQLWYAHAREVMNNVGKGSVERQLDNIVRAVRRNPTGISRSALMQSYHLSARDTSAIFETLEQRGLIKRTRAGRTEVLQPTTYAMRSEDDGGA